MSSEHFFITKLNEIYLAQTASFCANDGLNAQTPPFRECSGIVKNEKTVKNDIRILVIKQPFVVNRKENLFGNAYIHWEYGFLWKIFQQYSTQVDFSYMHYNNETVTATAAQTSM